MHTQGEAQWVVTRDGRQLYSQVLPGPGDAGVTVVFEAGYAAQRSTWASVQVGTAKFARAVVYDRSGLGRSAPDPGGRTIDRMAADLGDVLGHYGPGPYVVVGHSAGGPIVRAAAAMPEWREHIQSLVLVDPNDELADFAIARSTRTIEQIVEPIELVLAQLGLFRLLFGKLIASMPAEDVRADLEREGFVPQVIRTQMEQTKTFIPELVAWRGGAAPDLGDVPVTVISGTKSGEGITRSQRAEFIAAHQARAAKSPHGRHVLASNSAHSVQITDAELVIAEIRRLVEAVTA